MPLPEIILLIISALLVVVAVYFKDYSKIIVSVVLAIALSITSSYNFLYHPHYQIWLCNITALLAIILSIRYSQFLFDIVFYFAWTGDLLTFFISNNQTVPSIETHSIVWIAYWLKHICPLVFTVIIIASGKRLSYHSCRNGLLAMLFYTVVVAIYNVIFDQNILDLMEPTIELEKWFGPWPIYIFVDIIVVILWYLSIQKITSIIGVRQKSLE